MLFLDRMVLAVNGFMILNGQRRTVFHSVQQVLVLKRTAELQACTGSLQRTAISVFLKACLTSDQRVLVLKRTADLQGEIPCRYPEQVHIRAGFLGQAH